MNVFLSRIRCLVLLIACLPLAIFASPMDSILEKYNSGQLEQALSDLKSALSSTPNDVALLLIKAQIQSEQRDSTGAIQTYQKVIQIKGDHLEAYNNLAALYAEQGQLNVAKEVLESAIATHPLFNTLHTNLRSIYMDISKNHHQQALKYEPKANASKLAMFDLGNLDELSELDDAGAATILEQNILRLINPDSEQQSQRDEPQNDPSHKAVKRALHNWAEAWSNQDIENYLGAYRSNYATGGKSSETWASIRRQNLENKKFIKIALSEVTIEEMGGRYLARFVQAYESDTLTEVSQKELIFVLQAGRWKIEKEQNG